MTKQLSPILLRRLLRYEPETGKLFWRPRPLSMFSSAQAGRSWNARFAGKEAFAYTNIKGYKIGRIFNSSCFSHRVIWAMQTGAWPTHEVDHRDLDRANNRWHNLREATHEQNQHNTGKQANNTSGYKGVSWNKRKKKWQAQIRYGGKPHYIGYFDTPEEAHAAYCAAADRHHKQFANNGQWTEVQRA